MFGLLRPRTHLARLAYATTCRHQHHAFGVSSVALLSHEASWLYLFAIDAGVAPRPPQSAPTCCRLRARPAELRGSAEVGRVCAAVGVMLAGAKLDDDVRDSGSLAARAWRWWLRAPLAAARAELERRDPELGRELDDCLAQHLALERSGGATLEQYAAPTSRALSRLFGVLPAPPPVRARAAEVGGLLGTALVALDCARDWWSDGRRGQFNPLPDEMAVEQARDVGRAALRRAALACRDAWGPASEAAAQLECAAGREGQPLCAPARLAAWGVIARPGATLARFDCCCEGCACECCAGESCACEACCACDDCCQCCWCSSSSNDAEPATSKRKGKKASPRDRPVEA